MSKNQVLSAFVVSAFGASLSFGAPVKQTKQTLVAAAPSSASTTTSSDLTTAGSTTASVSSSQLKLIGMYEFMPTIGVGGFKGTGKHEVRIENYAELGVQFNPNTSLAYQQGFWINMSDPNPATEGRSDIMGHHGFLRAKFNNIINDKEAGFSFGYEPRLYAPTLRGMTDKGFITMLRNYLKFTKKVTSNFQVTVMEIPILFSYSKAGLGDRANETFENRIYLIPQLSLMDGKLSIELPINFHNTKYRAFAGAKNSTTWGHTLWIFPEIAYALTPNLQLGVSYESENLINSDMTKFNISEGLDTGVAHVVLRATL